MKFNPRRTLMNMKNTIKLTKKSDKDIYFQHLRLVLFGIATVGINEAESPVVFPNKVFRN